MGTPARLQGRMCPGWRAGRHGAVAGSSWGSAAALAGVRIFELEGRKVLVFVVTVGCIFAVRHLCTRCRTRVGQDYWSTARRTGHNPETGMPQGCGSGLPERKAPGSSVVEGLERCCSRTDRW